MKYYQKLDIENFDVITDEILKYVQPQISENLRFWNIGVVKISENTPIFFNFVKENFYRVPILFRFYNTPPFGDLEPHIDNTSDAKNKVALNIPLLGTKNTTMDYYTTDDDNFYLTYTRGLKYLPVQVLKDPTKITLVDSIELDKPALVRTDVVHGVTNKNPTNRLVLSLKCIGNTFEEIYKFNK
jgi:hypothetical protein